jgi:hypothetical protein
MKRCPIIASVWFLLIAGGAGAVAQEANPSAALDFESFRVVARKNIFDASRRGGYSAVRPRLPVVQTISLLGLSDDNGQGVAFFGGRGAPEDFLKVGDSIDGFKIARITLDFVQLSGPSNNIVLKQDSSSTLRREDNGPWHVSAEAPPEEATPAVTSDSDSTGATAPSVPGTPVDESDVIKRLRLKREQEDK